MPTLALTTIDAQVTGGNVICLDIAAAAIARGWATVILTPGEGPVCERARALGARVVHVGPRRTFRLDVAGRFARVLRSHHVDLLHTHDALPGTSLARLGALRAGIPVVSHAHVRETLHARPLVASAQRAIARWTATHACEAIVAVSQAVRDEIVAQGVPSGKVRVIPNGVRGDIGADRTIDAARRALGLPSGLPVILHVGRLCESKGQATLIRASALLQRSIPHSLLLVGADIEGGGAYRVHLEELAAEHNVTSRVHFAGFVADLDACYVASDVLALPSTIEGLPLVILEAMSAGRPVVASPVGGVAEAVANGKTGLLVPQSDPVALARALSSILGDPGWAAELGAAGRAKFRAEFSMESMLTATFSLYAEILRERS